MSTKGKLQVQRDAEIRLSKLEAERGTGEEFLTIILHDFNHIHDPNLTAQENQALWLKSQEPHIIKVPITPEQAERARKWEATQRK